MKMIIKCQTEKSTSEIQKNEQSITTGKQLFHIAFKILISMHINKTKHYSKCFMHLSWSKYFTYSHVHAQVIAHI